MKLEDKVIFVTGASGDVGPGICRVLAREGAKLICIAKNIDRLQRCVDEVTAAGGTAMAVSADVTDLESIRCAVSLGEEAYGPIDMLVNNAGGVLCPYGTPASATQFMERDLAEVRRVIELNLFGVINCIHEAAKSMVKRGKGKIVCVSSIDGLRGSNGKADYAASKAGIIAFAKSMAQELAPHHINVNTVCLGQMTNGREKVNTAPESWAKYGKGAILNRFGEPDEAGALIAFLLSDDADYITGQNYVMGGGCYM